MKQEKKFRTSENVEIVKSHRKELQVKAWGSFLNFGIDKASEWLYSMRKSILSFVIRRIFLSTKI